MKNSSFRSLFLPSVKRNTRMASPCGQGCACWDEGAGDPSFTCGQRIDWLVQQGEGDVDVDVATVDAAKQVLTEFEACSCTNMEATCNESCDCWVRDAAGYDCGDRILWAQDNTTAGDREKAARIVRAEHPSLCTCVSSPPATTKPSAPPHSSPPPATTKPSAPPHSSPPPVVTIERAPATLTPVVGGPLEELAIATAMTGVTMTADDCERACGAGEHVKCKYISKTDYGVVHEECIMAPYRDEANPCSHTVGCLWGYKCIDASDTTVSKCIPIGDPKHIQCVTSGGAWKDDGTNRTCNCGATDGLFYNSNAAPQIPTHLPQAQALLADTVSAAVVASEDHTDNQDRCSGTSGWGICQSPPQCFDDEASHLNLTHGGVKTVHPDFVNAQNKNCYSTLACDCDKDWEGDLCKKPINAVPGVPTSPSVWECNDKKCVECCPNGTTCASAQLETCVHANSDDNVYLSEKKCKVSSTCCGNAVQDITEKLTEKCYLLGAGPGAGPGAEGCGTCMYDPECVWCPGCEVCRATDPNAIDNDFSVCGQEVNTLPASCVGPDGNGPHYRVQQVGDKLDYSELREEGDRVETHCARSEAIKKGDGFVECHANQLRDPQMGLMCSFLDSPVWANLPHVTGQVGTSRGIEQLQDCLNWKKDHYDRHTGALTRDRSPFSMAPCWPGVGEGVTSEYWTYEEEFRCGPFPERDGTYYPCSENRDCASFNCYQNRCFPWHAEGRETGFDSLPCECKVAEGFQENCGWPNITYAECAAKGCCAVAGGDNYFCYKKACEVQERTLVTGSENWTREHCLNQGWCYSEKHDTEQKCYLGNGAAQPRGDSATGPNQCVLPEGCEDKYEGKCAQPR
jgi:hypothetical protein